MSKVAIVSAISAKNEWYRAKSRRIICVRAYFVDSDVLLSISVVTLLVGTF